MLEEFLAAEVLVIGVPDPALAQHLIGQVIDVLENREPRHQSRRQRWMAGIICVDLAEAPFQKRPIQRPRQLRQRMIHVDDLIEPGAKQILLARLPPFPWLHLVLRRSRDKTENHESICKESLFECPVSGKFDFHSTSLYDSKSTAWAFFTDKE